jgi:hypothetical protein
MTFLKTPRAGASTATKPDRDRDVVLAADDAAV